MLDSITIKMKLDTSPLIPYAEDFHDFASSLASGITGQEAFDLFARLKSDALPANAHECVIRLEPSESFLRFRAARRTNDGERTVVDAG